MAEPIEIYLPYGYEPITESDIQTGKNYVLRREQAVRGLSCLIDALLKDATEKIVTLCYQYNVNPEEFLMNARYNEHLFELISDILDELEEEILDLVLDYSTRCTDSEKKKKNLLPWVLLLGRDKRNLTQTLEKRLRAFVKDLEAVVVASKLAGFDVIKAVTNARSNLYALYVTKEMQNAFKKAPKVMADNIKTRGVKHGNVGNSNSEANNIIRFATTTVQMTWMHEQQENYKGKGAAGFYVLRGSSYPCDICQSRVGFHLMTDTDSFPPFHPHCVCFTVPVLNQYSL